LGYGESPEGYSVSAESSHVVSEWPFHPSILGSMSMSFDMKAEERYSR
jgi:hypothetical protein